MTTDGLALRSYLKFSNVAEPLYRFGIKRRLSSGKEHPDRYPEKFGLSDTQRPVGDVIWMHGVGLGEVLALRSLISALYQQRADLFFLITSSTRTSAEVFAANQPENSVHQFLPVDASPPSIDFSITGAPHCQYGLNKTCGRHWFTTRIDATYHWRW